MKFRNLSRSLLLFAGAAGISLGLTSCSANHTVGYVYVTGTTAAGQPGGQIGAYREDNNNGGLTPVSGGVVSSGGVNPIRAVTVQSRFVYVLNAGTTSVDTDPNSVTYQSTLYSSAGISLFSIGGYGQLSQQQQYTSQGTGTQRIAVDSTGSHLYVLDAYAPVGNTSVATAVKNAVPGTSAGTTSDLNYPCKDPNPALNVYHPVGSISVFTIDGATGRLQVVQNQQQRNLTYFPVGCFPVDFRLASTYVYTIDAGAASNNDLQTINVLSVGAGGQLTPTQTAATPVTQNNSSNITAINGGSSYIYLLDTIHNLTYAYTVGANGTPTKVNGSPFPNNTTAVGPIQSTVDSTGKYLYLANGGIAPGNANPNNPSADVTGYIINQTTGDLYTPVQSGSYTLGTVASPVCIFEDPTNQYLYVAGASDNSITGRKIDPLTGTLTALNKAATFPVVGTPSWCIGISSTL